MKCVSLAILVAATLGLGACAGIPPTSEEMAKIPVVRYGSPAPADGEFVLFYPAGAPLPVVTSVGGSLLEQPAQATLDVALKRDVYLYRYWVSFDGKTWQVGDGVVEGNFTITLPGGSDGKAPGAMSASFDLKS
jgi:hypothetical protein